MKKEPCWMIHKKLLQQTTDEWKEQENLHNIIPAEKRKWFANIGLGEKKREFFFAYLVFVAS